MAQSQTSRATYPGAVRLFQFAGINVFLHWTWALVAVFSLQSRRGQYESLFWNIAEYLSLFGIVLLHEFGHALACRSVGGRADRILLWPLGGVAYVDPPRRPGAVLWSIAAGPLVNVLLIPVTLGGMFALRAFLPDSAEDLHDLVLTIAVINIGLLIFNMLPIYPLDGGQIVQAILWYFVGQARSLAIAAMIGLIGAVGAIALAAYWGDFWLVLIALFAASRSRSGLAQAKLLSKLLSNPRYGGMKCPSCGEAPVIGGVTARCNCGQVFDPFSTGGTCPACRMRLRDVPCVVCRQSAAVADWAGASA